MFTEFNNTVVIAPSTAQVYFNRGVFLREMSSGTLKPATMGTF